METEENGILYRKLRRELLRVSRQHRSASSHPSFVPEHRGHLRTAQRQLGALRQAYRRTREVLAWERYRRDRDEGPPPGTGPLTGRQHVQRTGTGPLA